jgi:hypothetical protein
MTRKYEKLRFSNNKIGMSVPSNVSMEINDAEFTHCDVGFQMYDPNSVQHRLGLPPETPYVVILESLNHLETCARDKNIVPEQALKESKIWSYIERAADSATIAQTILAIYGTSAVTAMIASMTGG